MDLLAVVVQCSSCDSSPADVINCAILNDIRLIFAVI